MATSKSKKKSKAPKKTNASKKKKAVKKPAKKAAKKAAKKTSKKAAQKTKAAKSSKKKAVKRSASGATTKKAVQAAKKPTVSKSAKPSKKSARPTAQPKTSSKLKWDEFFTPLDDRLVVLIEGPSEKTAGGIIIPGTVSERPNQGQVLVTGRGKKDHKGRIRPMDVKVGETVVFGTYAGMKMTLNNQEVLMLREEDIMGVMQK